MNLGFQQFLSKWFTHSPGEVIYEQEKRLVDKALYNLFGYFLVQLGCVSKHSLLGNSRIKSKLLVDEKISPKMTNAQEFCWIKAELDFLPIGKEKADVVLLPHTLETIDDPYYLLRQVDSMLLPEGHIVITGFNPFACMPFRLKHISKLSGFKKAHFRRVSRLKEWLEVLGYEVKTIEYTSVMCFSQNEKYKAWAKVIEVIENVLKKIGFDFGNVYCLVAKKRVDSPTLVGLKWHLPKWQRVRNGAVASQRSGSYKRKVNQDDTKS